MSRSPTIPARPIPLIGVWELTRSCNAQCVHCGSAAGVRRDQELSTAEALDVVRQLADLGCRYLTCTGGEPLLRDDWPVIVGALRNAGLKIDLITNGVLAAEQASAIAAAGFVAVSFSLDGPEQIHDRLRGQGVFRTALEGARKVRQAGVRIGAVTQVNRDNLQALEEIEAVLVQEGFEGWQVQLTLPFGRAKRESCLSPQELPFLEKAIVRAVQRGRLHVIAADTIGWFSVREPLLRTGNRTANKVWSACQAGLQAVALTSDGTVRGCLAMPDEFNEGNLRKESLAKLWNAKEAFAYNRAFDRSSLQGGCGQCAFANLCRAGCTCLAWLATGTKLDNPYCTRRSQGE